MVSWQILPFSSLTGTDIHDMYQLRSEIFVVEQQCVYLDQDGKDTAAWHVLCRSSDTRQLVAYARIMLPSTGEKIVQFGRVAVAQAYRQAGLGKELLAHIMQFIHTQDLPWNVSVQIAAQAHLVHFYQSSGFHPESKVFLEDGIPHMTMTASAHVTRYQLRSLKNVALFRPFDEQPAALRLGLNCT